MDKVKTSDDDALALLDSLLRICRDSAEGYAAAVAETPDPAVRRELEQLRQRRLETANAVARRIERLRGDARTRPTAAAAVHRAWMKVRAETAESPVWAVLVEVERGENLAADAFRRAVKVSDIDSATRKLIQHEYEQVQAAHDRIRQLRDRADLARP